MTREKAIDLIFKLAPLQPSKEQAENWVNTFLQLGMLKLEEAKSAREKFIYACCFNPSSDMNPTKALEMIDRLGLKIVEK